ncbi:hypothetical protein [Mycobacterium sp. SMC-4]|uniref:hypothetical protein n=1 Tax=Mycobacterium sp. SMC-4 TaxID=2857059 RepID=UPI0021B3AC62|nr:hypothetical protein [Mycobacterium sp. SMC-4]UXA19600.1 hypothetical protein KXD98_08370 [Mycobacterium sp. SMC-4]
MYTETDWDDEVDVVCTGAGIAGLAVAISAIDEGADVIVADRPVAAPQSCWWPVACTDDDTLAYLGELTADLDTSQLRCQEEDLPLRLISADNDRQSTTVPPFVGSRMRDWAAQCICSPSGFLYTRVTDWPTSTVVLGGGETWEINEIGQFDPDGDDPVAALHKWLTAEAAEREIERMPASGLQQLVLDDGVIIGAVVATASGSFSVRARHGVLICPQTQTSRESGRIPEDAGLRVALVGKAGSRFGRVELLRSATAAEKR